VIQFRALANLRHMMEDELVLHEFAHSSNGHNGNGHTGNGHNGNGVH